MSSSLIFQYDFLQGKKITIPSFLDKLQQPLPPPSTPAVQGRSWDEQGRGRQVPGGMGWLPPPHTLPPYAAGLAHILGKSPAPHCPGLDPAPATLAASLHPFSLVTPRWAPAVMDGLDGVTSGCKNTRVDFRLRFSPAVTNSSARMRSNAISSRQQSVAKISTAIIYLFS